MKEALSKFIEKKFSKISKKKVLSNKSRIGGDIDILDSNCNLRKEFLKNKIFRNAIILIRHHRTGTRYDLIDEKGNLVSLDFLNGAEKNPLLYECSEIQNRKIESNEINLEIKHLFIIIKNLIKHIYWRFKIFFIQKPLIIEIFGVDGSGKTYLAKKIVSKLKKISIVKTGHLWRLKNNFNLKPVIPYQKKNYSFIFSCLKEFYISINFILLLLRIYIFSKRKSIYIFERSTYDVVIDPSRYRLSHKIFFLKFLHSFFFKSSKKIYLDITYNLAKKRKGEISKSKYFFLKKKLNNLFQKKFVNSSKLFYKL